MSDAIEPCLYCGGEMTNVGLRNVGSPNLLICDDCGARGMYTKTLDEAITAHNRIARTLRAAADVVLLLEEDLPAPSSLEGVELEIYNLLTEAAK